MKDKHSMIHKLTDTVAKLENGELTFIFFDTYETTEHPGLKEHLILEYQNIPCSEELSENARQAVNAIHHLVETLGQGAKLADFREEFEPVKGMDYSSLTGSEEYSGYQKLVVEWEKQTKD